MLICSMKCLFEMEVLYKLGSEVPAADEICFFLLMTKTLVFKLILPLKLSCSKSAVLF